MALIEEINSQGQFLFRWRSYVPGVIAIICIFNLPYVNYIGGDYFLNIYYSLFCLLISLIGQGIRFYIVGTTPANTSGRNTKEQIADSLNRTGIYSLVRHPLYLANFFIYLGVVLLVQNVYVIVIYILFFYLYYERIMFAEEFYLRGKFGDSYLDWSKSTPAFIPKLGGFVPASLPLSIQTGIRREYQGIFGVIFVFILCDGSILYFNEMGRFQESFIEGFLKEQWIALSITVLLYTICRILHKFTRLLEVEGRW